LLFIFSWRRRAKQPLWCLSFDYIWCYFFPILASAVKFFSKSIHLFHICWHIYLRCIHWRVPKDPHILEWWRCEHDYSKCELWDHLPVPGDSRIYEIIGSKHLRQGQIIASTAFLYSCQHCQSVYPSNYFLKTLQSSWAPWLDQPQLWSMIGIL